MLYTRRHLVLLQVARGNSRLMMAPLLRDAVLLWALHHVALRHLDNPEAAKLDAGLHPSQHTQGAERLGHALQGTQHRQVSCKDTVSCSTGTVNIRVAWAQDRQDEHPIADWLIRPVKGRSQDALRRCWGGMRSFWFDMCPQFLIFKHYQKLFFIVKILSFLTYLTSVAWKVFRHHWSHPPRKHLRGG